MGAVRRASSVVVALAVSACAGGDKDGRSEASLGDSGVLSSTSSDSDGSVVDSGNDEDLLDVGAGPDGGGNPGDCPGEGEGSEIEFSYVWIANSPEGTVSKIDTFAGVEVGRYRTAPEEPMQPDDDPFTRGPFPSRTAVNLQGDMAVANIRSGTIVKIAARIDDCIDANGNGEIETSSDPLDVLPFGEDECVSWVTDTGFDVDVHGFQAGPRPVAWDDGQHEGCGAKPRLWVGWLDTTQSRAHVWRLDGDTGVPDLQVEIDDWPHASQGPYGGATDQAGDFWMISKFNPALFRIETNGGAVHRHDYPGEAEDTFIFYGFGIDQEGTPWVAGDWRLAGGWNDGKAWRSTLFAFDRQTQSWSRTTDSRVGRLRGMALDADGYVWAAGNHPCSLVRFDTASDQPDNDDLMVELPGCGDPVGVSIDVDGRIWLPDRVAEVAYRFDPLTQQVETVSGLQMPYTYSDMTGAGLKLVHQQPPG